jgi:hypothetical protein
MATYSYAPHPEQRLRITLPLERGDKKVGALCPTAPCCPRAR